MRHFGVTHCFKLLSSLLFVEILMKTALYNTMYCHMQILVSVPSTLDHENTASLNILLNVIVNKINATSSQLQRIYIELENNVKARSDILQQSLNSVRKYFTWGNTFVRLNLTLHCLRNKSYKIYGYRNWSGILWLKLPTEFLR